MSFGLLEGHQIERSPSQANLFCVLNETTYLRLREAFPEVTWRKQEDYWLAAVPSDLATRMQKLCKRTWVQEADQPSG
jgi:hypothetical protein